VLSLMIQNKPVIVRSSATLSTLIFICTSWPIMASDLAAQYSSRNLWPQVLRHGSPTGPGLALTELSVYADFGVTPTSISIGTPDSEVLAASAESATAGHPFLASSSWIPDTHVYDQNGKELNFYSDIIKGNTAAVNFIFTTCTTTCPQTTAIFRRVQQLLTERGVRVKLVSISVDPTTDTPERLHVFAEEFKAGPGWTFVTGDKTAIDSLLRALDVSVGDKNNHTPRILIINDAVGYRTGISGLSTPAAIVQVITEAARHK
jgi:protein SCO1/2